MRADEIRTWGQREELEASGAVADGERTGGAEGGHHGPRYRRAALVEHAAENGARCRGCDVRHRPRRFHGGLRRRHGRQTEEHHNADGRRRTRCASHRTTHVPLGYGRRATSAARPPGQAFSYDALTEKFTSLISVLFPTLSVILISSRYWPSG